MLVFLGCSGLNDKPRVLILAKQEFYFHESTPVAIEAIKEICKKNNWYGEAVDDPWDTFLEEKLPGYAAVIFLNTAGDVLNPTQEALFERYIQSGGGFVGIHTAVDTEHNWDWYGDLVGGRFESNADVQDATLQVLDPDHISTRHMDPSWMHRDEWFNLTRLSPHINVVLSVDETTFEGGKMGGSHPVSWYHAFNGGRSFTTALGHTPESYSNPAFLQHIEAGIRYAIGKGQPIKKLKPRQAPKEKPVTTGFVKNSFANGLYEPMEFDMLPDGRILLIERRGGIKLYDPATDKIRLVAEMDVFQQNEEGLIGLAIDPDWEDNHWIYLYYSPAGKNNTTIHLARFQFDGDSLELASKQLFFEVKTDRHISPLYHAGGCLQFDDKGFLYLSTGDNSDHQGNHGFATINELPGFEHGDSQRSSSNSMDFRGKIHRIKPLADGSYLCPADNLYTSRAVRMVQGMPVEGANQAWKSGLQRFMPSFASDSLAAALLSPGGGQQIAPGIGRPEIYVMGVRNPFRFDIDNRRNLVMWGDVGPDAGADDPNKGPRGYDEFNIASKAGYFGWPYFIGNNQPYRDYDFAADTPKEFFDPQKPFNDSPNNKGEKALPPAQPALIWYPFASSPEFPELFNGTRCSMGGPMYYTGDYPADTRFPDRFDGKWIIYDWSRNWMMAVELDSLNQFAGVEAIAPSIRLARPMDMLIDKNGSLWILEYGTEWYSQNPDACITRIDYVRGSGGEEAVVAEGNNHPPMVRWDLGGKNRSFYLAGDQLRYKVDVEDAEDGSVQDLQITPDMVEIGIDYIASSKLPANYSPASLQTPYARGKELIGRSDCQSCHAYDKTVNGPSYLAIADRYKGEKENALKVLPEKITLGGSGNWGETAMIAHPDIPEKDALEMSRWIMSLSEPANRPLPFVGTYYFKEPDPAAPGSFVFFARYRDKGFREHPPLTSGDILHLRNPLQQAEAADSLSKDIRIRKLTAGEGCELRHGSSIVYKRIDLKGIQSIEISLTTEGLAGGGRIDLHLGSSEGRLVGTAVIPGPGAGNSAVVLRLDRSAWPADGALYDLFFVVENDAEKAKPLAVADWFRFKM